MVPVHIMNMSSMNRFHVCICWLAMFIRSFSNFPINRFAYAAAILVPMAVPCVCR